MGMVKLIKKWTGTYIMQCDQCGKLISPDSGKGRKIRYTYMDGIGAYTDYFCSGPCYEAFIIEKAEHITRANRIFAQGEKE